MSLIITIIGLCVVTFIASKINALFDNTSNHYSKNYNKNYYSNDFNNNSPLKNEEIEQKEISVKIEEKELVDLNYLNMPILVAKLMEENPHYFLESYYDLNIDYGDIEITNIKNVFEDVSPQYLCFKLIHNIALIQAFTFNFVENSGGTVDNPKSKNKKLFLRLRVGTETVELVERRGFGIMYNVDDMAYALSCYYSGIANYIKELSNIKKYEFLDRVISEYLYRVDLFKGNPDEATMNFFNNNKDFYIKQIKEVEELLKHNNNI